MHWLCFHFLFFLTCFNFFESLNLPPFLSYHIWLHRILVLSILPFLVTVHITARIPILYLSDWDGQVLDLKCSIYSGVRNVLFPAFMTALHPLCAVHLSNSSFSFVFLTTVMFFTPMSLFAVMIMDACLSSALSLALVFWVSSVSSQPLPFDFHSSWHGSVHPVKTVILTVGCHHLFAWTIIHTF